MKWFLLNVGEILIDEKYIPVVQSCSWYLNNKGYIQATNGKYKGKYLHQIIAEKAGLDIPNEIDHIDGNPKNNLVSNLRPATHAQNMQNSKIQSNNILGIKGVEQHGNRYRAKLNGKHLRCFDTAEEASEVRWAAAKKQHKEFARFK